MRWWAVALVLSGCGHWKASSQTATAHVSLQETKALVEDHVTTTGHTTDRTVTRRGGTKVTRKPSGETVTETWGEVLTAAVDATARTEAAASATVTAKAKEKAETRAEARRETDTRLPWTRIAIVGGICLLGAGYWLWRRFRAYFVL